MALIRFQQFDPASNMLALQQELDRFLRSPSFNSGISGHGAHPLVNMFDDGEGVVIIAELPGTKPSDISVSGQNNTLTISGSRSRDELSKVRGYHRRERRFGEFSRSMQLPVGSDISRTEAHYENGVLTLRIPKTEEAKPRQISVQSA
jgi:HSP20 family protein